MQADKPTFRRTFLRRGLAVLACAILLYFALGATLLHQHTGGSENACHVCQSLHMPALAATALVLVAAPELIARCSSQAHHMGPSDSFSLHRASRAPPIE
ncbi:MAG TPA: hypothetical protein VE077_09025 [Candidatus Methylomirabilis sp.]|nr:hypothetical protein [Candidatus Methylomirabilis sp.]